jgi:hypothetical protein
MSWKEEDRYTYYIKERKIWLPRYDEAINTLILNTDTRALNRDPEEQCIPAVSVDPPQADFFCRHHGYVFV